MSNPELEDIRDRIEAARLSNEFFVSYMRGVQDAQKTKIEQLHAELAEARNKALEEAAEWHDQQASKNSHRGWWIASRDHQDSATTIRQMKRKT